MNILILSVGTRNKIIQYFKKVIANDGKVIATDMSRFAPAIYEADKFYLVPPITDKGYLDVIEDICKKEKVNALLSLIDPELSLLSKNIERFSKNNVLIIGSSHEICELCLNKWKMYIWLQKYGYNCARTFLNKEDFYKEEKEGSIVYPVFVKPVCGSASNSISKVYDRETIELLFANNNNLMIQEFLDGQEIGADVYIDMITHEVISIFTKKKIVMRAGETDKAISFKNKELFNLIEKFVLEMELNAQVDIDIFEIDGIFYISEVNPRFGGGYPHAYECGCDHMTLIKNNLNGIINKRCIGQYEEDVCMMKYNEIMCRK